MARYPGVVFLTVLPLLSLAGENPSALDAMKVLPKQEVQNLALIAAYGGTSDPQRWHFVVYDPNTTSGVREYVVEGGELVAARGVSQFADSLTKADVIESQALQVDSDKLTKLVKDYATANNITITSIGYQLQKTATRDEPVWRVTCIDGAEKAVGALVVSANQGKVVSYEGFAVQPKVDQKQLAARDRDSDETSGKKRPSAKKSAPDDDSDTASSTRKTATASATSKRRSSERRTASDSPRNSSRRADVRPSAPELPPPPVAAARRPNPIGGLFRKLFAR